MWKHVNFIVQLIKKTEIKNSKIFQKLKSEYKLTSNWLIYGRDCNSIYDNTVVFVLSILRDKSDLMQVTHEKITLEQIHSVRYFLSTTSIFDGYKVVIIKNIASTNQNAINALLKTLEETPSKKCLIIIISSHLYSLPPAFRSRCCKLYCASAMPSINMSLYRKLLQSHKQGTSYEDYMKEKSEDLFYVFQMLLLRLVKAKFNTSPSRELFTGEVANLQEHDYNIEDLYEIWENILKLNQDRISANLVEEQFKILLYNSLGTL